MVEMINFEEVLQKLKEQEIVATKQNGNRVYCG